MLGKRGLQTGPKGYKFKRVEGASKGSKNGMFGKSRNKGKFYNNVNPNIYIIQIKNLIENELTAKQVSKETGLSIWYVKRIIKTYLPQLLERSKLINKKGKRHNGKHKYPNPNKGKTLEQIMGFERAAKKKEKMSKWMHSEKNIRRYCKHPSKEQVKLFELVKQRFPTAVMECPVQISENKTIWLDIAVAEMKINFEYDGIYWHRNKKEEDKLRDKALQIIDWKVFRFEKIPKELSVCV